MRKFALRHSKCTLLDNNRYNFFLPFAFGRVSRATRHFPNFYLDQVGLFFYVKTAGELAFISATSPWYKGIETVIVQAEFLGADDTQYVRLLREESEEIEPMKVFMTLFESDEEIPRAGLLRFIKVDFFDRSGDGSADGGEHFHGFEND